MLPGAFFIFIIKLFPVIPYALKTFTFPILNIGRSPIMMKTRPITKASPSTRKVLNFIILITAFFYFGVTQAEQISLSEITLPTDTDNVYVHKIASDTNSTDFVIFIVKEVPLHKHLTHTETIFVLEGRGMFQLGDSKVEIGPGDYLRIPENTPHAVTVLSAEPLKVLSVQAPEFFGKDRVFIKTP